MDVNYVGEHLHQGRSDNSLLYFLLVLHFYLVSVTFLQQNTLKRIHGKKLHVLPFGLMRSP
jgi:hypothetical protein